MKPEGLSVAGTSASPVIALEAMTFGFGHGQGPFSVPFSHRFPRGEITVVTGPNGIGKTTLLYLVAGLLTPGSGAVRVCGRDPREASARSGIGFLFPGGRLLAPRLTLSQNAAVRGSLTGTPRVRYDRELSSFAALAPSLERPAQELSTGTLRRAELAFAFAEAWGPDPAGLGPAGPDPGDADPRVGQDHAGLILLDEPERSLDASGRTRMLERLADHVRAGGSALVATPDETAIQGAHRILRFRGCSTCEPGVEA